MKMKRIWSRIALFSLVGGLSACSVDTQTPTGQHHQAATAEHNRVLSFETPAADWSTNNGSVVGSSTTVTEGAAALAITPNGYTEIVSIQVDAPGAARSTATLDIDLPQALFWGEVRLVVRVPSQQQWWRDLGSVPLAGLSPAGYQQLTFNIPQDVQSALNSSAADVDYRIILNVPGGSGTYLLDNLVVADQAGGGGPSEPPTSEVAFSIAVPSGTAIPHVMISGSDRVTIDDRSTLGRSGSLTGVAGLGSGRMEFGAGVQTHANVSSTGIVDFLRSQSRIYGSLTTPVAPVQQDNVQVDGGIVIGDVSAATTTWSVDWPSGVTEDISLPPDTQNTRITPGAYDSVQVYSRAALQFESGTYFINSLVFEPEAKFFVDASAGPVVIYVQDTLRLHVGIEYVAGELGSVLFGYIGSQPALFQEAIVASVIAPNSDLELRRPNSGRAHRGSFFGRHVHVFSDATVEHIPLELSFVCPSGDFDDDNVLDCFDECWRDPAKTARGVCGCGKSDDDSDNDLVKDCDDQCPLDAGVSTRGMCGCPSDPDVAPEGELCNDGLVRGLFTCNGAGICGEDATDALIPPDCFYKTIGTFAYVFCGTGATGNSDDPVGTPGGASALPTDPTGAAAICSSFPTGRLLQISSVDENAWAASIAALYQAETWIGAADFTTEGNWFWRGRDGSERTAFWQGGSSGSAVDERFFSWTGDAPVEDSGLNCATIDGAGEWRARDCGEARPFICEMGFGTRRDVDAGIIFDQPKGPAEIIPGWMSSANRGGIPGDPDSGKNPFVAAWRPKEVECENVPVDEDDLEAYRIAQDEAARRCDASCGPDEDLNSDERDECDSICDGEFNVPPATSTCDPVAESLIELDYMIPGTCQVLDFAELEGDDDEKLAQLLAAQDCSGVHLDGVSDIDLTCGTQTLCLALDGEGSSRTCGNDDDCSGSQTCECLLAQGCDEENAVKYCVDPFLTNACQRNPQASPTPFVLGPALDRLKADGTCEGQCFARVGCGLTEEEYLDGILARFPWWTPQIDNNRCDEKNLCGPEYYVADEEGVLEETRPFADEDLEEEAEIPTPNYTTDFATPCNRGLSNDSCIGFCFTDFPDEECGRVVDRHLWCSNEVSRPYESMENEGDDRTSEEGEGGSPVSFTLQPVSDLQFNLTPLPYGAATFNARAAAGVRASVDFDVLGIQSSVELVDLKAEISASLCRATTKDSRMEVVGVDFLPALAGKGLFDTDEVLETESGQLFSEVCEEKVSAYIDAFDRAKKALRDAQELILQYNQLKDAGQTFSPDFCETVAGIGMRPPGMGGACPESPRHVINRFIEYYHKQALEVVPQAVSELADAMVDGADLRAALGISGRGDYTAFTELGTEEEESVTIVSLQFFIGPIPCLLEVTAYADYGIKGGFGLELDPDRLIGGQGNFAQVGAEVGPFVNSGITLFVGAGFNIGILELAVGVEGGVTLGHVSLPAVVSAGLNLTRQRDRVSDRPLPEDLALIQDPSGDVLFPTRTDGGLTKYSYQFNYKYGVGLHVTDILTGYLDGTLKVSFAFFSKKFSQRIATFSSDLEVGPIMLIEGDSDDALGEDIGGGSQYGGEVASGEAPWRKSHESVALVKLDLLDAPETVLDPVGVFQTGRVLELYYDELCKDCVPSGEICGRDADCCDVTEACVPGEDGESRCGPPACVETGDTCTDDSECCGEGEVCLGQLSGPKKCGLVECTRTTSFACSREPNHAACCAPGYYCSTTNDRCAPISSPIPVVR